MYMVLYFTNLTINVVLSSLRFPTANSHLFCLRVGVPSVDKYESRARRMILRYSLLQRMHAAF